MARQVRYGRRHKYDAVATVQGGQRFDSKREARRYQELQLLVTAGEIRDLRRQVWFVLVAPELAGAAQDINAGRPTGRRPIVGRYVADFTYTRVADGVFVVEDAKGYRTPLYRWKARHFAAQYGFPITEV